MLFNIVVFFYQIYFKVFAFFAPVGAAEKAFDLFSKPMVRTRRSLTEPIFKSAFAADRTSGRLFIKGFKWTGSTTRTALLAHGFQGDSGSLARFYTAPLLENGFTVLAFDGPAHGLSEGNRSTINDYSRLLKEVLEAYPEIEVIIAHSFGCPCTAYALEESGQNHRRLKLAFIAPAPKAKSQALKFAGILDLSQRVISEMFAICIRKSGRPIEWFSMKRFIGGLNADILIVHDKTDDVCPFEDSLEIAQSGFSNITFVPTEGFGHSQIYKEQNTIDLVIEFCGGASFAGATQNV